MELFGAVEAQEKMDSPEWGMKLKYQWIYGNKLHSPLKGHIPEASEKHQDVQVTSKEALRNFKNLTKTDHSFYKLPKEQLLYWSYP